MKLLLDESLPHQLRSLLEPIHEVFTVVYMKWAGIGNGRLLDLAASNAFDAILTTDRGYEYQQNVSALPCAVVLILSPTNKIDDLIRLVPEVLSALATLQPRMLIKVS